ncbi:MAG: CDP-alcohol phosphatidyltransferase family protein [Alphaproteobacteria bacterium]
MMSVLPNLITLARLFMVPVTVLFMLEGAMGLAFGIFVLAGISDGLDGYLARRFDARTRLGAWLDPLADKALLVSIFVTLGALELIPLWVVVLVAARDMLIVGGILLMAALGQTVKIKPIGLSKANTAFQIILAAIVLADLGFALGLGGFIQWFYFVVAATTVLSGAAYVMQWLEQEREAEAALPPESIGEDGSSIIDIAKPGADKVREFAKPGADKMREFAARRDWPSSKSEDET